MTLSPTVVDVDEHTMWVGLSDGRTIGVPLAWFPRLLNATGKERREIERSLLDLHWDHLEKTFPWPTCRRPERCNAEQECAS